MKNTRLQLVVAVLLVAATLFGRVDSVAAQPGVYDVTAYGAKGDGVADDTADINEALAAAVPGSVVIFPPPTAHYKITAPLTVPAGVTVKGGGRGCEIRQYATTFKPIFDCLGVDDVTIEVFTLTLNTPVTSTGGAAVRSEAPYVYCAGVWSNGSGNTFRDLRIKDFPTGIKLSSWDGVSALSSTTRKGNTIRDIEVFGHDFGIVYLVQENLRISGINGHDAKDSSSGVNPIHTIYGSGNNTLRSKNVVVSDCVTRNNLFGTAYQIKYTDGLSISNMVADTCDGLFNGVDITDATFANMVSRNDSAGNSSFNIQKVAAQPARLTLDSITIQKTADTVGTDRCMSLVADDVKASNLNFFPKCNIASDNYAAYVRGNRISIDGIKITNTGSQKFRGILVGSSTVPTSDISLNGFEMTNVKTLVDFDSTITGNNTATYGPAVQRDIATTHNPFNSIGGPAAFHVSRKERVNIYTVAGGGTYKPMPGLETVTWLNVTVATAFTIGSPLAEGRIGMTQDIVIANSSGGTLGAVTWSSSYVLRSPFNAPANGDAARITFVYDGTKWRELAR